MPPLRSARSARAIVAVLIVSGCALGSASSANAAPVACGDTITTSVTLTADLVCQGNGLMVLGFNITINLNGHTINGPGAATITVGIIVSGQALIQNGTIRGFGLGLQDEPASSADGINLRVTRNGGGIDQGIEGHLTLRRSYVNENAGGGIGGVICAGGINVFDSQIVGNGGDGITAHECAITAARNVISGNRGYGIWNEEWGVDLRDNQVNNNGLDGIHLDPNSFNDSYTLLNNIANRNGGHGIVFNAHRPGNVYPRITSRETSHETTAHLRSASTSSVGRADAQATAQLAA
jgi:hypothetical protein